MQIVGLGNHILETPRVRKLIDAHGEIFLQQVFTEREILYCRERTHSTEYYAAFWASKEAVFRSLGLKWRRGVNWHDIEIICESAIEPRVETSGPTRHRQDARSITRIMLSFSYSRLFATATAISVVD